WCGRQGWPEDAEAAPVLLAAGNDRSATGTGMTVGAVTGPHRELTEGLLPRHPGLRDLDAHDRIGSDLEGVVLEDDEIRFLARLERADAVALPDLLGGAERHRAERGLDRDRLVGADHRLVDVAHPR